MKLIIHWNKFQKQWTMHTYKSCELAKSILVIGGWKTEVKPEKKSNPRGWVVTDHENVIVNPDSDCLNQFRKTYRLIFDKENISFNITEGEYLLFDESGCYVVQKVEELAIAQ